MDLKQYNVAVVGAGIVGLATARELVKTGLRVVVLEKEKSVGQHQSSRNSGVIHSGLYYRPGSAKAAACVEGAAAMVAFCREEGIPFEVCGKVVVATTEDEIPALEELHRRGKANGLAGLRPLSNEEIREIEPHCTGICGIHVPGTGITDYGKVTARLAELIVAGGGEVRTGAEVTGFVPQQDEVVVKTSAGEVHAKAVVNCAGLHSDRVCRMAGDEPGLRIVPFRGEYYELAPGKRYLVRNLVYPVPDPRFPFLGAHFTRRIRGGIEAGPNAVPAGRREGYRWTDVSLRDTLATLGYPGFWRMAGKYWRRGAEELYRSLSRKAFAGDLRRLVPEIQQEDLQSAGSGVRAQALSPKGELLDDFAIVQSRRFVHVLNAPSPAATASLVFGRQIAKRVIQALG